VRTDETFISTYESIALEKLRINVLSANYVAPAIYRFYREFGPDTVRKSGQTVSRTIEWSSVDNHRRGELLFTRENAE
jgi:hypothetical protein